METHQKDIEEKDPFGQNRRAEADEADEADDEADEKSFLKALLAERALKKYIYAKLENYLLRTYVSVLFPFLVMVKDGIFSKLTELMSFKLDIGQRSLCARDSLKIPNLNR